MKRRKCNVCAKDFDMWDEQADISIHKQIPYGSVHDGEHIDLDLCCSCFDSLMEKLLPLCKLPPLKDIDL